MNIAIINKRNEPANGIWKNIITIPVITIVSAIAIISGGIDFPRRISSEDRGLTISWSNVPSSRSLAIDKAVKTDSAFLILYAIVELGRGCTQKEISQMYYMSKQTINSSVKNLEKSGYIEFRQDKGNNKRIFLTPAGEKLVEEKITPVINIENDIFADMTPDESRGLLVLTQKYADLLRKKSDLLIKP